MQNNGMDFRRKEVINITDGKRLRICARCVCRFRNWKDNFYNCALIENRKKSCNDITDEILDYPSFF